MKYVDAFVEVVFSLINVTILFGLTGLCYLMYTGHVTIMQSPQAFMLLIK